MPLLQESMQCETTGSQINGLNNYETESISDTQAAIASKTAFKESEISFFTRGHQLHRFRNVAMHISCTASDQPCHFSADGEIGSFAGFVVEDPNDFWPGVSLCLTNQ